MAEDIEKMKAKAKALKARERELNKKVKEKEMKAEFERLKEFEKEQGKYARQGKILNDILVKYNVKNFDEGFAILEKTLVSMKSQEQNN